MTVNWLLEPSWGEFEPSKTRKGTAGHIWPFILQGVENTLPPHHCP